MRNIVSFLSLLLSAVSMAQIPNSNFENWSTINGYQSPDNWDNLNKITFSQTIFTCYKGTPGQSGNSYLALITRSVTGKGIVPGRVVSGKIDTITFKPISGFPFALRPQNLNYYLQYMPYDPSDTCSVKVILTKWNSSLQQRDTIALGLNNYNAMAHSWFLASVYLNYQSGNSPDSAIISISSSGVSAKNGSYLYIDNMYFSGDVIGISEIDSETNIQIYPNPANDKLEIKTFNSMKDNCVIEMKTINGKLLLRLSTNEDSAQINLSDYTPGIYLLSIKNPKQIINKKIIKYE